MEDNKKFDGYEWWIKATHQAIYVKKPEQPFPKLEDYHDPTLAKRMELQCKIEDHKERKEQRSSRVKTRRVSMFPFFIFGAIN